MKIIKSIVIILTLTVPITVLSYPPYSPYSYCLGNPINCIDPTGCDTVHINYANDKWHISQPIIAKGDDVFIVTNGKECQSYTFSDGEYGNRVDVLNMENNGEGSFNLGVYHVSGSSENATGFFVTPGGKASITIGSGKRIPDGTYPFTTPTAYNKWRTPGVGGNVAGRGIRFHYGGNQPLNWTEGCFVISSDYTINNGTINYDLQESINSSINFNNALGASKTIEYTHGRKRTGAIFNNPISHILILKTK